MLPAATAMFLGYFAYHAVHGDYGMVGRSRLESRSVQLTEELTRMTAQREALETRVKLLRPDQLDQDMLDERARAILSMANPNEVVIMRHDPGAVQNN